MPVGRGQNFKQIPINVVGSSIFGRYPKISVEKTYNMFSSDNFLVPYAGYQVGLLASKFDNETEGRGIFSSIKFEKLVVVLGANVYLVTVNFNQNLQKITSSQVIFIGSLNTATGPVYITENNTPQIALSDGVNIYIYDPTQTPSFQSPTLSFTPGYITFHDTYFLCAASNDTFGTVTSQNSWRLSSNNDGLSWPNDASHQGLLQSKPDNTQAVVRFPSKGNMIFVMGSIVTEAWFDTGAQLFPYQRNNQFNIDYGCLSPATVAYMDEIVVWLASNEKSGPIIVYSNGGMPKQITTDGIDYLFSTLQSPEDSQAFLYRQDGHLFYHINFYTDNLSLFYDFNTDKFYHASDQDLNYFIAAEIAFYNNQYYFVSKNTGNLYVFDTQFYTYQDTDSLGDLVTYEIPRIRTCANVRLPSQDYFIANDIGFTIESGETNYDQQDLGPRYWITQDGNNLISEQIDTTDFNYLIFEPNDNSGFGPLSLPRVDLSISIDGGASFSSDFPYVLNAIGQRKNRLMWWQIGLVNDFVPMFKFWGIGRFVATDGLVNIRQ